MEIHGLVLTWEKAAPGTFRLFSVGQATEAIKGMS